MPRRVAIAPAKIGTTSRRCRFTVRSLPDTPLCVVNITQAGRAASGTLQMQQPTGELFEARIAGRWDEATHTFDGVWVDGKGRGGSITFRLQEP